MRSRRSLKVSHTQTSVPCGMLNSEYYSKIYVETYRKHYAQKLQLHENTRRP